MINMKCVKCGKNIDIERDDWGADYDVDTCLECMGNEWEYNMKHGIRFHLSISGGFQ